jgi:hypothetical protein
MIVLAVMFGWMILVYILSIAVSPRDPNVEVPIEVNLGVVVTPADGWYSAADVWDTGPTGISLQSSGAYVAFWVEEYPGGNDELLAEILDILRQQYESFRVLPAVATMMAGDLPALSAVYSGVADYGHVEGELVVGTHGGIGVVIEAEAQEGQLARVQGDLDYMLDTLVVPR